MPIKHPKSYPKLLVVSGVFIITHVRGIVALVGSEPVPQYLMEGLRILEARGYDSAGISTIGASGELVTTKFASSGATNNAIELVQSKLEPHSSSHIGTLFHCTPF
jgi:glucosamine 6-phosphate synthetase-like amidotransferase/phosphosugar isomerase protein